MKEFLKSFAFTVSLIIVLILGSNAFAAGKTITIKGSTTVLPIAQATAEAFMDANPGINISIQGGGSSVGITSLIDGTCDIADSSRSIKTEEIEKAKAKGINVNEIKIAMDGIAIIVNPKNKMKDITKQQIKDIYTGKISDWSELGAAPGKIVVISRDTSSGTYEAFEVLALNKEKVRPDALIQASNQAIATTVGTTPGAIGYVGHGYLTKKVKDLPVEGVTATKETILSGKYSLSRPLFMYTNGAPAGDTKKYIDFVLGKSGKKIIEEEGFVGLK